MNKKNILYFLFSVFCWHSLADNIEIDESTKKVNNAIMDSLKKNHETFDLRNPTIIKEALKGLVAKKNDNINESIINHDLKYMEFSFSKKPTIYFHKDDGTLKISYYIFADIGKYASTQTVMNLISNNTHFDTLSGRRGKIEINFEYTSDGNTSDHNKHKIPFLNQLVKFKFEDIAFVDSLKMPEKITIFNTNSSILFPCFFVGDVFYGAFNKPDRPNNSYTIMYRCEKLPNFNDYGGNLKIIFDNTEFL